MRDEDERRTATKERKLQHFIPLRDSDRRKVVEHLKFDKHGVVDVL
jgi:hypothetical protein